MALAPLQNRYTPDQLTKHARALSKGVRGTFAAHLADAYMHADRANKALILTHWESLFTPVVPQRSISFEDACNAYPHRFTCDHMPVWAHKQRQDGTYYAPQFHTDREWYDATKFPGEQGEDSPEGDCYTTGQTWPLGKALRKPFNPRLYANIGAQAAVEQWSV
jgi:hypothetical protein